MAHARGRTDRVGTELDAVVVGSGPNGLAAAIVLARAGLGVRVFEAGGTIGGGMRTMERTLPGFRHDVCSAVHPMAVSSPFFRSLAPDLARHGLKWIHPDFPVAHPMGGARAAVQERDLAATVRRLGVDGGNWEALVGFVARRAGALFDDLLGPLPVVPRHPISLAGFGVRALWAAAPLARHLLATEEARALFAGHAAHSILPLERTGTAAVGLMLAASAHHAGWPIAKGGSQSIADAMAAVLRESGGAIETGHRVRSLDELPAAAAILFDTSPREMATICGDRLPARYVRRLRRFRYGPAAFKLDLALSDPVPWRNPDCRRAGTVHVGGPLEEVAASEDACWRGRVADRPFVLVSQPTVFDPSRAPAGKHVLWAYCHVPHAWEGDATGAVLAQIERFAPGFRDTVLECRAMPPAALEHYNPNYIGGDIVGGVQDLAQQFARPVASLDPYATPARGIFLCSSSTPPGAGVHGMCGFHAARSALKRVFARQGEGAGFP